MVNSLRYFSILAFNIALACGLFIEERINTHWSDAGFYSALKTVCVF